MRWCLAERRPSNTRRREFRAIQAGYGATAIRTTGADLQAHTTTAYTCDRVVTEEAGRVFTDPRRPEYML